MGLVIGGIMKIAITADCHLKSDNSNLERYQAFKNILDQLVASKIDTLIIAGDLFDKDANNFSRFEKIIGEKKYSGISILSICGNHDSNLKNNQFIKENFFLINNPTWQGKVKFGIDFLLIPYERNKEMGEIIEKNIRNRLSEPWVLICHGNFLYGNRKVNPYEPGIYMPLSRADVRRYKPLKVFIGHIHKPYDSKEIIIPGSPCGLDITEAGKRSYIVFDSTTLDCSRETVETKNIFLDEQLMILPSKNEEEHIQNEINNIFRKWEIDDKEKEKIILRLVVNGYSSNVRNAKKVIDDSLKGVHLYEEKPVNFDGLKSSSDIERDFIVEKFEEYLERQIENSKIDESLRSQIYLHALNLIYER